MLYKYADIPHAAQIAAFTAGGGLLGWLLARASGKRARKYAPYAALGGALLGGLGSGMYYTYMAPKPAGAGGANNKPTPPQANPAKSTFKAQSMQNAKAKQEQAEMDNASYLDAPIPNSIRGDNEKLQEVSNTVGKRKKYSPVEKEREAASDRITRPEEPSMGYDKETLRRARQKLIDVNNNGVPSVWQYIFPPNKVYDGIRRQIERSWYRRSSADKQGGTLPPPPIPMRRPDNG